MARKPQARNAKPSEQPPKKYFVAPIPETPARNESGAKAPPVKATAVGATKYFTRRVVTVAELDEVWRGTGPELPPHYENAEGCPDCSAFRHTVHARLCPRNPRAPWNLAGQWETLHTREQIFFGVGHPKVADVDSYMTLERQEAIARNGFVVLYDVTERGRVLAGAHVFNRAVIVAARKSLGV